MTIKGIIFDFDGTLADTLPVCITSFKHTLEHLTGKKFSDEDVTQYFGKSEEGISKLIAPLQWENCLDLYVDYYKKNHYLCESMFEGIQEILDYLKDNNFKIAMVTGRGDQTTQIGLEYFDIGHYFEFVETGSPKGSIKPECMQRIIDNWDFDPENIAYIGDSVHDIHDSNKVGIKSIAVSWASTSNHDSLKENKPYKIFNKVQDFKEWIEKGF